MNASATKQESAKYSLLNLACFLGMTPDFTEDHFNPSSMDEPARQTGHAIAAARKSITDCPGHVDRKEILFTSCATESDNAAIVGTAHENPNRRHSITTSVEHPAVIEVCKELERNGYKVTHLGVGREGKLDVREFIQALSPNTPLGGSRNKLPMP